MNFGENLKKCRLQAGLTQTELAEVIGVAQPTIAEYEVGKKTPTLDKAIKIAKILGTTCEELFKERTDEND